LAKKLILMIFYILILTLLMDTQNSLDSDLWILREERNLVEVFSIFPHPGFIIEGSLIKQYRSKNDITVNEGNYAIKFLANDLISLSDSNVEFIYKKYPANNISKREINLKKSSWIIQKNRSLYFSDRNVVQGKSRNKVAEFINEENKSVVFGKWTTSNQDGIKILHLSLSSNRKAELLIFKSIDHLTIEMYHWNSEKMIDELLTLNKKVLSP